MIAIGSSVMAGVGPIALAVAGRVSPERRTGAESIASPEQPSDPRDEQGAAPSEDDRRVDAALEREVAHARPSRGRDDVAFAVGERDGAAVVVGDRRSSRRAR